MKLKKRFKAIRIDFWCLDVSTKMRKIIIHMSVEIKIAYKFKKNAINFLKINSTQENPILVS